MNERQTAVELSSKLSPSELRHRIESALSALVPEEIVRIAERVRAQLTAHTSVAQEKGGGEIVTEADLQIQRYLLAHFARSPIAGLYVIKAEEDIALEDQPNCLGEPPLQLLIDPLDGTNPYVRGEPLWGTMIGISDREGELLASWNMIYPGTVYSSTGEFHEPVPNWNEVIRQSGSLTIDVFDYGAGASERFIESFASVTAGYIPSTEIRLTAYPSAVAAGWELIDGGLNGILWLPSNFGKRTYPDYDLIFLGAVKASGWQISLGKRNGTVEALAVAPTVAELELLEQTGRELGLATEGLTYCRTAAITAPVERTDSARE